MSLSDELMQEVLDSFQDEKENPLQSLYMHATYIMWVWKHVAVSLRSQTGKIVALCFSSVAYIQCYNSFCSTFPDASHVEERAQFP